MKPLSYQEVLWNISLGPSEEELLISAFESEQELFESTWSDSPSTGTPIDLWGLMGRSDLSTPRWTRHQVSTGDARDVGRRLWEALPPAIKQPLMGHSVGSPPMRIKIASEIPGVADIPWEWLFDGTEPPFALRPNCHIVRSVPVRFPVPPLSIETPIGVLLVVPNPKDERLLDADREIASIQAGLPAPTFDVRVMDQPSFESLGHVLVDQMPHILHFIGHGGLTHGEGNLILQDPDGRSRWVGATELAGLLPASVRLVCLATPYTTQNYQVLGLSHLARALGLGGLPTTLTNQYPVSEPAVEAFWRAFYAGLIEQAGNVNDAYGAALVAAADATGGFADWAGFSLVVRDQTGVPFDLRSRQDDVWRQATEIAAQFAAQLANELAVQVQALGEGAPDGVREQYETEQSRASGLLDELAEEE